MEHGMGDVMSQLIKGSFQLLAHKMRWGNSQYRMPRMTSNFWWGEMEII
jgi:hypothetical protein